MTGADVAFILKTGSLEVASAGWQIFAWVVVVLFALAYVLLIAVTFTRGPQRPAAEDTDELDVPEWMKDGHA